MNAPLVSGHVVGAERVHWWLKQDVPDRVIQRLGLTVKSLGLTLERKVKLEKLRGQVLGRRSGRLVRSINTQMSQPTPASFTASVGTNLIYGRFWELGFRGVETVRAHTRAIKSRNAYKYTKTPEGKRKRSAFSSGVGIVRAHTRHVNNPGRPFLRPALNEMREEIRQRIGLVFKDLK